MVNRASITVRNAQRKSCIDLQALEKFSARALHRVLDLPQNPKAVIKTLDQVTVVLVSDQRMAALHQKFLHTPGATDVITFQDGDIFISVETAQRNARRFETSLNDELRLYIVHGLLHLDGFDDVTPAQARVMRRRQQQILEATKRPAIARVD